MSHEDFTRQFVLVGIGLLRARTKDRVGGNEVTSLYLLLNCQVRVVDQKVGKCAHKRVTGALGEKEKHKLIALFILSSLTYSRINGLNLLWYGNVERLIAIDKHCPVGTHREDDRATALVEDHLAGDAAVVDAVHPELRHKVRLRLT